MRRLFESWDTEKTSSLGLQNVVTGLAAVKGTRDIMSSISYFFELYDDDNDGKVDREGILGISEALLFLSRRGLEPAASSASSASDSQDALDGGKPTLRRDTADEQFLSSVSAFIRRCFEYADPDHPSHREAEKPPNASDEVADGNAAFSIGEDDESDLIDVVSETNAEHSSQSPHRQSESSASLLSRTSTSSSRPDTKSANLALDPANPLHITLPTFRMVILADETLERFFDSAFSNSFRLSDAPLPPSSLSSSNLTTFSNAASRVNSGSPISPGGSLSLPRRAPVPPGKGIRGMLDNIVSDGMRVASEVRRRMEEAQREMDRAVAHGDEDDEDNDRSLSGNAQDAERRSVREADRDLLEGAEADVAGAEAGGKSSILDAPIDNLTLSTEPETGGSLSRSTSQETKKVVEFER